MENLSGTRGILFDLDGVFYVGNQVIEGAGATIAYLKNKQIPYRFVTNTSTQSRDALAEKIQSMGLPIAHDEIISSPYAARLYLDQAGCQSCCLVVAESIKNEFETFVSSDSNPDAVVIGDIGDAWNYDLLNRIFHMVMAGSQMVALHKGKFWQTEEGLHIDIGAFVAGLEYVTGKQATIIGKPSPDFFQLAIQQLNLPANQVVMIGDDIDSDVGGAQQAGLKGILVRTGKYREAYAAASSVKPDLVIDSVAALFDYLKIA